MRFAPVITIATLLACGGAAKPEPETSWEQRQADHSPPDEQEERLHSCLNGDGSACWLLGQAYERGDGGSRGYFPPDLKRAAHFYWIGCERGHVVACTSWAELLQEGRGTTRDAPRATSLFVQSCERGEKVACFEAGMAFEKGDGVRRDARRSNGFFQTACDAGFPAGCGMLEVSTGSGTFSTSRPPEGAAGFRFGSSIKTAERACRAAGYAWSPHACDGRRFRCTGPASELKLPAVVDVVVCDDGNVCRISLWVSVPGEDPNIWMHRFAEIQDALWQLHGKPGKRTQQIPEDCRSTFRECLMNGKVRVRTAWGWQLQRNLHRGLSIELLAPTEGAIIHLFYAMQTSRSWQGL